MPDKESKEQSSRKPTFIKNITSTQAENQKPPLSGKQLAKLSTIPLQLKDMQYTASMMYKMVVSAHELFMSMQQNPYYRDLYHSIKYNIDNMYSLYEKISNSYNAISYHNWILSQHDKSTDVKLFQKNKLYQHCSTKDRCFICNESNAIINFEISSKGHITKLFMFYDDSFNKIINAANKLPPIVTTT